MEEKHIPETEHRAAASANFWLVGLVLVLLAATVFSFAYGHSEKQTVSQLVGDNQQMSSTISEMRSQLDSLNQKLVALTPPPAPPAAQSGAGTAQSGKRAAATDRRLKQMQSQLAAQEEALKRTQNDVAETRTDLVGDLNSTRSELNGSIARTHEELVVLEKRGERNYFEFDAAKSKQFVHAGPLNLTLSKTDTKHANIDLVLLVNDREISKKGVNLYEPVWIYETQDSQPVQVVINKIEKNWAHGYVSAPKYSRADLSAISAPPAPPTSTRSGTSVAAQSSEAAVAPTR